MAPGRDHQTAALRVGLSRLILVLLIIGQCSLFIGSAGAQGSPPDVRFGAVESFSDPAAAAEAGVGWERILFYWSELQPNGPEEWNGYHVPNDWLTLAAQQGREVIGLVKHTPAWATDGLPGCGVPRGLDLPVDDPDNLWATFVRRVVQTYAEHIDRWVIWNEPDIHLETYGNEWCGSTESYYRLLKVAYLAAHEVNPDVQIHLAGLTFWHDRDYLGELLSYAVEDPTAAEHDYYFDVATVHVYFQTETVPYVINEIRAALADYGLRRPIWVNETNASPDSDPQWPLVRPRWRVSLEEQASFLLQSFALALSAGAERVAVYKLKDVGLPAGGEPFGLIRPDGSRRPAFTAYQLITQHYAGTVSAREARHAMYDVVTLDRGGRTTRVLWARGENDVSVTVPALAPGARLIGQMGAEQQLSAQDGVYTLTLPAARCADEYAGCIIGGPTYLLVEESEGTVPPTATDVPISSETPIVVETAAATPSPAATEEPPTPSATSTAVPTETPTHTPSATAGKTPTPTPTQTSTATPTPSATATRRSTEPPTAPPTDIPARPSATSTTRQQLALRSALSTPAALLVLASLVASATLVVLWLGRLRRS